MKPDIDQLAKDSALLDSIRQEIEGEGFTDMGDLHLTIRQAISDLRAMSNVGFRKMLLTNDALRDAKRFIEGVANDDLDRVSGGIKVCAKGCLERIDELTSDKI